MGKIRNGRYSREIEKIRYLNDFLGLGLIDLLFLGGFVFMKVQLKGEIK